MNWINTYIISFREALEVVFTLVILACATRGLNGRWKWLCAGIAGGSLGALVIAVFIDAISDSFSGMGQEILFATTMGFSGILIAYTVIWMSKHSRELAKRAKDTGIAVAKGRKPMIALSLVMGLTVLRDGAEMVLLSYGIFVSSANTILLQLGIIGGLVSGVLLGMLAYWGSIKLNINIIFKVLGILLACFAAGMIAQSVGYLTSAGYIGVFTEEIWDTSWLISEQSLIGSLLAALVGYISRPTYLQVLSYGLTLATVLFFAYIKVSSSSGPEHKANKKARALSTVAIVLLVISVINDSYAIDKIYSPMVHEGEIELENRGTMAFDGDSYKIKDRMGIGYGVTDRYATEILILGTKSNGTDFDADFINWENRVQLFEQGEYWIDVGVYLEYEYAVKSKRADKLEGKILLEKVYNRFLYRANLTAEREIFAYRENKTEGVLSILAKYRLSDKFEPAIEYFWEVEDLSDVGSFDDQEHYIGPAIYAKPFNSWKIELSYLFGISDSADDGVLRWALEYEM